jgi:small subunit ribosomal protein S17
MKKRGNRKIKTGIVVSDAMDKTVVVKVARRIQHSLYKKFINRSKKFKAHDSENKVKIGDIVKIQETRPLSKDKRWRVVEVIRQKTEDRRQKTENIQA